MNRRCSVQLRERLISRDALERVLREFAILVRSFHFDRARALLEEEKTFAFVTYAKKREVDRWVSLLTALINLVYVEKAYFSLSFLVPKGFLRKENKTNYNACRTELQKILTSDVALDDEIGDVGIAGTSGDSGAEELKWEGAAPQEEAGSAAIRQSLVQHLVKQFHAYVSARISIMEVYALLANLPSATRSLADAIHMLKKVQEKHDGSFHHPFLCPIEESFTYECDILAKLLSAHQAISEFRFLTSLINLRDSRDALFRWVSIGDHKPQEQQTHSWFSWADSSKKQYRNMLCSWIVKYQDALLSKFTLYFHETLAKQAPATEFAKQVSGISVNYMHKIEKFYRRNDVKMVCLLLKATDVPGGFEGLRYCSPERVPIVSDGIGAYPLIYTYPPHVTLGDAKTRPSNVIPRLVMVLNKVLSQGLHPGEIQYYALKGESEESFFISPMESYLYLFLVFSSTKNSKDSNVSSFVHDIYLDLQCSRIFASLKAASK